MTSRETLLEAVAAFGLVGTLRELPNSSLPPQTWSWLLNRVISENLTGLLALAIDTGAFPASERQRGEIADAHVGMLHNCLLLERLLLSTAQLFEENGIEYRVLKGVAVAHLDYPDPSLRGFGDLDLLVRSEQFDDAARLLSAQGCCRYFPEPRYGFDRRFNKGATFATPEGYEVDLHRTFAFGPAGLRLRLSNLWDAPVGLVVGNRPTFAMPLEQRALNACFSVGIDARPRLMAMRDVAQFLLYRPLRQDVFEQLVEGSKAELVVARAICESWRRLGIADVTALSAWAARFRADERARRELALYTGLASTTAQSLASLRAIPKMRDRAAFLAALTFPKREFLRGRANLPRRLGRGLVDLTRARRSA